MFEFFAIIFNIILYRPLFNFLVFLYNYLPGDNLGFPIIILTVIIFLILSPVSLKALKSQKTLTELQPQIREIQRKYKDDKEKQIKETMDLYQKAKINPFGGCLPLFLQTPILIALFLVFKNFSQMIKDGNGLVRFNFLYSFVSPPQIINTKFLGFIELTEPSMLLAILGGVIQFIQTKTISAKAKIDSKNLDFSQILQKQMIYFFPILTIFILWKLSSAIALYWITNSFLSIIQHYLIFKKNKIYVS